MDDLINRIIRKLDTMARVSAPSNRVKMCVECQAIDDREDHELWGDSYMELNHRPGCSISEMKKELRRLL